MKKNLKWGFLMLAFGSFVVSCKHSTDFDALPKLTYTTNIAPIIKGNCTFSGCHGDTASKEFKLLTFEDVMKYGKVTYKKPNDSRLYTCLVDVNGEKIMPKKPYSLLTEKQIELIYIWIGQGAPKD